MTKEQLQQILQELHLEYFEAPSLVYVFYQTDDGLVNNFSISVRRARQRNRQPMTAAQLADLMQREYPATRQARLLAVEHPREGLTRWLDSAEVCRLLHTTRQTVNRWAKEENWESLRAAKTISRRELVVKMLYQIDQRLEAGDWTPDELVKAASAIEKLDKNTNAVTVIEVMTAFNKWLVNRAQYDPALTGEMVETITKYQDIYISEILSNSKIEN